MERNKRIPLACIIPAVLGIAGGAGGYLYYYYIGCASGACAITSDPYVSTIYGAVLGILTGVLLSPAKRGQNAESPADAKDTRPPPRHN